jgi:hypothetical protein
MAVLQECIGSPFEREIAISGLSSCKTICVPPFRVNLQSRWPLVECSKQMKLAPQ